MMNLLRRAGASAHAERVRLARERSDVFVAGLLGIEVADFQRAWHRKLETEDRLVLWAPVEHGKTFQLSTGYAVWCLGRNPRLHGLVLGASLGSAVKILSAIRRLIDESRWVREVFPHLKPQQGRYAKWSDDAIRVEGQAPGDKDYSFQAIGIGGSILGARIDLAIGDDLCTFETTATALQRQRVTDWWRSTVEGRLTAKAQALVLGNAWFPDDVMHRLVRESKYASHRDEAYRELPDGSIEPASILWPKQWTRARLEKFRERLGSDIEARRQMRCIAYASGSSQFELGWFDRAFELGAVLWPTTFGTQFARFLARYDGPMPVVTGVDLGVSRKPGADFTSIFTMAIHPTTNRRYPLKVQRGRWTGPEIIERLKTVHVAYGGRTVVENNAAQDYLAQWLRASGVMVETCQTGANKADPRFGVPSIAQELEGGLWVLPTEPEMHQWRADCLGYSPERHVGDVLMSSWFAREAARKAAYTEGETVDPDFGSDRRTHNLRARYNIGERASSRARSYAAFH
jgi:hypothetical protein